MSANRKHPGGRPTKYKPAMPANILRAMLREKIEEFMPAGALKVAKVAEESEREHLERWASIMSNFDSEEAEELLYL